MVQKTQNNLWPDIRIWLFAALAFFLFLFLIKSILLPFVVGMLTAYFLDPAADWLESKGLSRTLATLTITGIFFSIVTLVLVLLLPIVFDQLVGLISILPDFVHSVEAWLLPKIEHFSPMLGDEPMEALRNGVQNFSGTALRYVGDFAGGILQSGLALLNLFSLIFITPVVAFYLLRDWDSIVLHIHSWLPRAHAETIKEQLAIIDRTLAGFVRGQMNVCLLLGLFYGIGLSLTGLHFGFAIGLMTGMLAIIPYAGIVFGLVLALAVAFFQFDHMSSIIAVAAVFAIGQFLEGNFITPRLVGSRVGLHPLWIIFGMLAGAALFGFVGVLIAVPVTAVLGVLMRFALSRYLASELYQGGVPPVILTPKP